MFEATLQEPERHALSSLLTVRWFNAYFVQKIFAAGQRVVIYGKPKARGAGVVIDHPEFEIIENEDDEENLIHLKRITPVYATTEGLGQRDDSDLDLPHPRGGEPGGPARRAAGRSGPDVARRRVAQHPLPRGR